MSPKSSLVAIAKWDYKPKDTISGWLSFNKKDRITRIAFPYPEFWCWSGMNSKGKWGIFPKDFVDSLIDTGSRAGPALSPGSFTASPISSGSASHRNSRGFTLSGGSYSSHGAEKKTDQDRHASHLYSMKRRNSGFTSRIFRRSATTKSHMSGGSTEYAPSIASHGSSENRVHENQGMEAIKILSAEPGFNMSAITGFSDIEKDMPNNMTKEMDTPTETDSSKETDTPKEMDTPTETDSPREADTPKEVDPPKEADISKETAVPTDTNTPKEADPPREADIPKETAVPTETNTPKEADPPKDSKIKNRLHVAEQLTGDDQLHQRFLALRLLLSLPLHSDLGEQRRSWFSYCASAIDSLIHAPICTLPKGNKRLMWTCVSLQM
jgi:hypothetical protein